MARDNRLVLMLVYAGLLALLAATMAVSQFQLGWFTPALNLGIAAAKTALILWFFMRVRVAAPVTALFACAGFFWLLFLFGLALTDYLWR